jgi:two-component system cell cycle sensor histidine kinase/response regulator CckA
MPRRGNVAMHLAAFALASMAAAAMSRAGPHATAEALLWAPTGVAAAGVWLLGLRAAWIVALCVAGSRIAAGYEAHLWVPAALGSTAEAVAAALLLRALALRADFARLRDVLVLLAAAAAAPLASIAASWLARTAAATTPAINFAGWWRMNALGVLAIVPLALVWLRGPSPSRRAVVECAALAAAAVALVAALMLPLHPGVPAVMLLTAALPLALFAALRLGPRGAVTTGAATALAIVGFAEQGVGAFQLLPFDQRHAAVQAFLFAVLGVPLVFGALVAERESSAARWLDSEGVRRALVGVLPDLLYKLDGVDGRVLDVVVPPGHQLPRPVAEMLGKRIADFAPPALAAQMLEQLRNARLGLPTLPVEYPIVTPQGRREREMRCVRLPTGELIGVVRDITARKLAERQLAWQARVLERVAAGHSSRDVLPAMLEGLETLLPDGIASILVRRGNRLHLGHAPSLPAAFRAACDGLEIGPDVGSCGTAAWHNHTVVCEDVATDARWERGRDLALAHGLQSSWSVPVRGADGAVLGTFAIYHRTPRTPTPFEVAVVERAAVIAGLAIERERREELLASIQRNISEGLFRMVPGQGIVHANDALARMFGYASPAELLQQFAATAATPSAHRDSLLSLAAEFTTAQRELELSRRDGTRFSGLVSTAVVHAADGTVACDGTVADVTARKELELRLRHSQKLEAVGQLAGGVAHDFNNLLTAISGYAEAVRDELPDGSAIRRDVGEILAASDRAAALTRQLLAFARRQVLTTRVVDVVEIVEQIGDMMRRVIGERVRLVTRHAVPHAPVQADRGQVEQVLLNLVLNARDAMPDGGTITITTDVVDVDAATAAGDVDLSVGRHVLLAVADDGCGMSEEVRARAFDPFFTTKEPGKGTGLGLSTVYGIVRQSGGAIRIDTTSGHGTAVRIHLPHVAAAPDRERPLVVARPTRAGTVLVVEDEQLVRDLAARSLARAGHTVLTAPDGEHALQLVAERDGDVDVVVSDVVMPAMGGPELAVQLRRRWPNVGVVLVSGYTHELDPVETLDARVAFLHKPFTASALLEAVDRMLPPGKRTAPVATPPVHGAR